MKNKSYNRNNKIWRDELESCAVVTESHVTQIPHNASIIYFVTCP